ncbi:MAG: hypothetical protein WA057_01540 [Candidatus Magasanikiibacteriota bacterium]
MKKFIILIIALFLLTGCSQKTDNQQNVVTGYREWPVSNDLMGPVDSIVEEIQINNGALSKNSKPIYFLEAGKYEPTGKEIRKNIIQKFPLVSGLIYELVGVHYQNTGDNVPDKYALKFNNKTIFEHEMCYGAEGPIQLFQSIEEKISFTFSEACQYSVDNKVTAISNIFYDDTTINEKFGVEESKHLFSYKDKIGFIGKKNNAWYIFFNEKQIPYQYDGISDIGCCATPYFFKIYENGTVVFLAGKQNQSYIIEINLNNYL